MPSTTRSMSHRMKLSSLPWIPVTEKMSPRSLVHFYMGMPANIRKNLKPILKNRKEKMIGMLRSKINFRGPINTRVINPSYIYLLRKLSKINNNPNNYYESRNQYSTGYHSRRVQAALNLLRRLRRTNNGYYVNNQYNNLYNYNKRGTLTAVPRVPGGVYVTVARGIQRSPGGRLSFKLKPKREKRR